VKSLEITFYKTFFLALLATIFTIEVSVAQWQTKVDSLIKDAIAQKAFPGAQVLVAFQGEILLEKAYGFHTYDSLVPVQTTDLYDLASVTKILGPLPAIMALVEQEVLELDAPFSTYWTPWKKYRDKKDLTLREILAHQAGLTPYIVFLNEVIAYPKRGAPKLKKRFVRERPSNRFTLMAYENKYIHRRFPQKMYRKINRAAPSTEKKYNYSGLAFLLFPSLIEQLTGEDYRSYMRSHFYDPLGAHNLGYLPAQRLRNKRVVPTERDSLFRKALTQNYVHDENAALFGGVSGNAGLFSNAASVYKILNMWLQGGSVGGRKYLSAETISTFTAVQYPENNNRRGLGFDKPLLGNNSLLASESYPAPSVSPESYGHSGFTGTFVWVDPFHELIYIFLSNRVYPSRTQRGIYTTNIRETVQEAIYKGLGI
jgi:CubicO group peptidase (beta-lactamase class C family)